jgi:hypothetical protein
VGSRIRTAYDIKMEKIRKQKSKEKEKNDRKKARSSMSKEKKNNSEKASERKQKVSWSGIQNAVLLCDPFEITIVRIMMSGLCLFVCELRGWGTCERKKQQCSFSSTSV